MKKQISYLQGESTPGSLQQNSPHQSLQKAFTWIRRKGILTPLLIFMFAIIQTASAQESAQVTLLSAQLSVNDATVSKRTSVQLEMFRFSAGKPWYPNHCYELFVSSQYQDPTVYQTFQSGTPPTCTSLTAGITVSCQISKADTIQLRLSSVDSLAAQQQSIRIDMDNFYTPFSSQVLKTINVRYYSDDFCTQSRATVSAPSVTIIQGILPTKNVQIQSSSNRLGNSTSSNFLSVTFTPQTTTAPDGAGTIEIGIPYWYILQSTGERMYSPTAANKCSSSCMKITSSGLENDLIRIKYDNMVQSCIKGVPITIICRQFYNPITPEVWPGFQVTTYDNEVALRIIEQSSYSVALDATKFLPAIMPTSSFIVDPTNTVVSTYSVWTMSLKVNIPLMPDCWVQIFLPPDFGYKRDVITAAGMFMRKSLEPQLYDSDLNIIFRNGADIPKSSVFFQGCSFEPALGREPFGRLDVSFISTQSSIKDSDFFEIKIWKDQNRTMLIAELEEGVVVKGEQLEPGMVSSMTITPANYYVQKTTNLTIVFTTSHELQQQAAVTIRLPTGISPPPIGTVLIVTSSDNSTLATTGIVLAGNLVQIQNLTAIGQILQANTTVTVTINGLKNQFSAKDAGEFTVTTQNKIDGLYYTVDESTSSKSYTALPGTITAVGSIKPSVSTNDAKSNIYTFTFTLEDEVSKAGYIQVTVPPQVVLQPSSTLSTASCKVYTCLNATPTGVRFLIADGLQAGQNVTLEIGGVTNPRSIQPSGEFIITTLDTDAVSKIDDGYRVKITMQNPGPITSFSTQQTNFTNGDVNTYTFSTKAAIPVIVGDKFTFTLPAEVGAPADTTTLNCQPRSNIQNMTCSVSGQVITITLLKFSQASGAFSWTISGIKNPGSTKPTERFTNVNFLDKDGFIVSAWTTTTSITNKEPSNLLIYSIEQASVKSNEVTNYKINFTPVNPLPSTGSIQMTYPQQISLINKNNTVCNVSTATASYTTACKIDDESRTITITGVFVNATGTKYAGPITIELLQVKNAINNRPGNGFVIQTYFDAQQTFIMDKLNDFIMLPRFECDYPCQTCTAARNVCLSCWMNFDDPQYLMNYGNGTQTCRPTCELGYSSNGTVNKQCAKCDPSCLTCRDNGNPGDVKQCIDCALDHPFRISLTDTCLKQCILGMYQSTNSSCSFCKAPCEGCSGTEATCTSCVRSSAIPNLFVNQCIDKCPQGYVSMDGVCTKCTSPCALCSGTPDGCDTCDGTGGTKFVHKKKCYADCPAGTGPDAETLTCFPCLAGCDLCDIVDKSKCLKCTAPTLVHNGVCVDQCPDGWNPNEENVACRPWQLSDWGILYFPFLIAAAIFTIIVLFGMMKRRAYIHHGKMALYSPQNTLTCIIIAIAPLQFFATIVQWILSYIYGTSTFAILALLVTVAAVIVNIVFQVWFARHFNSKKIPDNIERRVRLNKMTREEAQNHKVEKDEKFINHKRQHRCFSYLIFSLTATISFKFNKCYYSFFYDMKMYQANFTQAKYYRKMMTWYQIIYLICIDLCLICIDVTGLTKIESGNQLYITMIETLVLSFLSIILGALELWRLKELLSYTEQPKDKKMKMKKNSDSDSSEDWDKKFDKDKMKDRREMMGNLLKQVKHNKQLFLNNKLDDLLAQFGDRKAKSMLELATGWQLEDDPRMVITWPISPMMRDDYAEMDLKFTKDDAYGAQGNNVYADAKSKYMGMDFGTQDDAGYTEFQDALNRKAGGLMSQQEGDLEERRMKAKNRRRGRKNKYYAQIDHEDDQEADHAEASDQEGNLQIIKEQEEEEENMRKAVQAEASRQQEGVVQRKKQLEDDKLTRANQERSEAEARKLKAQEIEAQGKAEQLAAAERTAKASLMSKKLQEEAQAEKVKRDEEEKRMQEVSALQSSQARADYDKAEALRFAALKIAQDNLAAEAEAQRLAQLEIDKNAKLQQLSEAERLRAEKDAADLAEKKRLQAEQDALRAAEKSKQQTDKDAQNKNNLERDAADRAEKERLENERIQAEKDAKDRQKAEEKQRKDLERAEKAASKVVTEDLAHTLSKQMSMPAKLEAPPLQDNYSEMNETMNMASNIQDQFKQKPIDVPPNADLRTFNVNDILGELDRDDKGNVVVELGQSGDNRDKQGNLTNQRGYLLDQNTGAVIENLDFQQMFSPSEMDERGEVPGPFCVEKYNFNPHQLMGDFDYHDGKPQLMQTNQGFFMDKKSRRVNKLGWMCLASQGHLVDSLGRKKFDKSQLTKEGDLPKLYNYLGRRFDIKSVMGQFEKDINSRIVPQNGKEGLCDNLGRRCNDKGYLIDAFGNIIDINGKQLWKKTDLKNGEFPKIFPFTKFNIRSVRGDFQIDAKGQEIHSKDPSGKFFVDRKGRKVNSLDYLIDAHGNVVDGRGKIMFDKIVLEEDGEIPSVFREEDLFNYDVTGSELSSLVQNLEQRNTNEFSNINQIEDQRDRDGETSMDSQMEDTPANYNDANQRYDDGNENMGEPIPEDDEDDGGEHMAMQSDEYDNEEVAERKIKKKTKKRKPKLSTIEFLQPTGREKNMAGAYGGQAIGSIRRPGIKYEPDRLEGSKKFRVTTADEPKVRAQLSNLVKSQSGVKNLNQGSQEAKSIPHTRVQGLMGATGMQSNENRSQRSEQRQRNGSSNGRGADSRAKVDSKRGGSKQRKGGMKDGDFEQMFGKDIDQFLEDSEWDIESMDKVSQNSRDSVGSRKNELKLKQMEKLYLKRLEAQGSSPVVKNQKNRGGENSRLSMQGGASPPVQRRQRPEKGPDRETIMSMTDDPGVLHRGEMLPFNTKKTLQTKK